MTYTGSAGAVELRPHLEAGAGHFLSAGGAWQGREIGFGGVGAAGLELGLSPRFGVEARFLAGRFLPGTASEDQTIRAVGSTGLAGGTLGFRAHPFEDLRGFYLAASAGAVQTGGALRGAFDARAGWDFRVTDGSQLGPFLSYLQVVQPGSEIRSNDARAVILGIHAALDGGVPRAPRPRIEVVPLPPEPEPLLVRCAPGAQLDPSLGDEGGCLDPSETRALAAIDQCPDEPEDYVGGSDADGCPKPGSDEAAVVGERIVIGDRIYFEFNYWDIRIRSWPLLRSVARLINAHPDLGVIEIHGHADEIGDDVYNDRIAGLRAAAVRKKLIDYGVSAKRLIPRSFGKRRPVVLGHDEESRQRNRRVEFVIEQRVAVGGRR